MDTAWILPHLFLHFGSSLCLFFPPMGRQDCLQNRRLERHLIIAHKYPLNTTLLLQGQIKPHHPDCLTLSIYTGNTMGEPFMEVTLATCLCSDLSCVHIPHCTASLNLHLRSICFLIERLLSRNNICLLTQQQAFLHCLC